MNTDDIGQDAVRQVTEDLIYLCSCTVNGNVPDAARVAEMDLSALFHAADQHMLTAAAAYALETAGVHDRAFAQAGAMAIQKTAVVDHEMAKVLERLEAAGIWYMPLKGAVLKDLYPAYGIREMADRDILFDADRSEEVRDLMRELGFTLRDFDLEYHDSYYKEPVTNIEMHRRLFSTWESEKESRYYADVKSRLLKDDGNEFGWHFSPDDFYIYMVAHEHKHYSMAGTGLRSVLDTYVYLKNTDIDYGYVTAETEKIGIAEFERANRELATHLFGGEPLTEADRRMLEYTAASGVFGMEENRIVNVLAEKGRAGYFLSRLTIPYGRMLELYPVLKKAPVLYPFFWAYRLVHALLFKNKTVIHQLRAGLNWKEKE